MRLQSKLCILQHASGERTLDCHLARGQSKAQARRAFELAEIAFSSMYEKLLQQPAGTFDPGQPGRHKEQSELPRHHGGFNLPVPTLVNVQEPAAAGAMVGIIVFFGKHIYRLNAPLTAVDPVNPQIPSRPNPPGSASLWFYAVHRAYS